VIREQELIAVSYERQRFLASSPVIREIELIAIICMFSTSQFMPKAAVTTTYT
jgi:hypothetical protein